MGIVVAVLLGQELDHPLVYGQQLRERNDALGGGGLVGDAYQCIPGSRQPGERRRGPGQQAHVLDVQRRLAATAEPIDGQLVDDAVAIEEHGRARGARRLISRAGRGVQQRTAARRRRPAAAAHGLAAGAVSDSQ